MKTNIQLINNIVSNFPILIHLNGFTLNLLMIFDLQTI